LDRDRITKISTSATHGRPPALKGAPRVRFPRAEPNVRYPVSTSLWNRRKVRRDAGGLLRS
jgi:hypothetical protein